MKGDPKFTLYWRTGRREVVEGRTIAEAMTLAGYSSGAVRALDFYATGDDRNYRWEANSREWVATPGEASVVRGDRSAVDATEVAR